MWWIARPRQSENPVYVGSFWYLVRTWQLRPFRYSVICKVNGLLFHVGDLWPKLFRDRLAVPPDIAMFAFIWILYYKNVRLMFCLLILTPNHPVFTKNALKFIGNNSLILRWRTLGVYWSLWLDVPLIMFSHNKSLSDQISNCDVI